MRQGFFLRKQLSGIPYLADCWPVAARGHKALEEVVISQGFNIGTKTLSGKAQIRHFFATENKAFMPQNHWESDTPSYKIKTTVHGDKGTLYFECHYVDVKTGKVVSVVGVDHNVQKINGKWLIVDSAGATPVLHP